jgi:2-phospho-L-lactate guanylyltransferase
VVPVKSFARAKVRLRERFSAAQVETILQALLEDVLHALLCSAHIDHCRVVTSDPAVEKLALGRGARVQRLDPDPGLNPALERIAAALRAEDYGAMLVALGDLPLLRPRDVDAVVEAGLRSGAAGMASADGGTALLLTAPPGCVAARFGPESFDAHRAAARERGLELGEWRSDDPSACIDLDTPQDAERIARSGRPSRTAEALRKLGL